MARAFDSNRARISSNADSSPARARAMRRSSASPSSWIPARVYDSEVTPGPPERSERALVSSQVHNDDAVVLVERVHGHIDGGREDIVDQRRERVHARARDRRVAGVEGVLAHGHRPALDVLRDG